MGPDVPGGPALRALEDTVAEALAAAQEGHREYAVVPLAGWVWTQEVARLARAERAAKEALDAAERAVNGRVEAQLAFWAARRCWTEAYLALHAAVDGHPEGEGDTA